MSAADLITRIDAARGDHQRASDLLAEARERYDPPEPPPAPPDEGIDISAIGHTVLDVLGFIPVAGAVPDLINAVWYGIEGDYGNAALSAVGAIPGVGDAVAAVRTGVRGVNAATDVVRNADNAADTTRATDTAAQVPREINPSGSGPVVFYAPEGATPEQIEQVRRYVDGCNAALADGALSPTGRVSTQGALGAQATTAARQERRRAEAAGDESYRGQHVGHVPDATWVGRPEPHSWMPLDPQVNGSLAGQSGGRYPRYPLGYQPTEFIYGGVRGEES